MGFSNRGQEEERTGRGKIGGPADVLGRGQLHPSRQQRVRPHNRICSRPSIDYFRLQQLSTRRTVLRSRTGTGFPCPMSAAAISVDFKSAPRGMCYIYLLRIMKLSFQSLRCIFQNHRVCKKNVTQVIIKSGCPQLESFVSRSYANKLSFIITPIR